MMLPRMTCNRSHSATKPRGAPDSGPSLARDAVGLRTWPRSDKCVQNRGRPQDRDLISPTGDLKMRYELTDYEGAGAVAAEQAGVPRVDDRRVLNGIFWGLRQDS